MNRTHCFLCASGMPGQPHRSQGWRDSGQDARVDVGCTNVVFHGTGRLSRACSDFVLTCWATSPEHLGEPFPLRPRRHRRVSHPFRFLAPICLEKENLHPGCFLVGAPIWRARSQIAIGGHIQLFSFFHRCKHGGNKAQLGHSNGSCTQQWNQHT